MNFNVAYSRGPAGAGKVIALHCSGGGARGWRGLAEALGDRYQLATPEHYGCESAGPWSGEHAFTLEDEAARTISLIDSYEGRLHLVGHSYGGCVALCAALARPGRIASLTVYEPPAFHLLTQMDERGAGARAEIAVLGRRICEGAITGDYRGSMASFVSYWNGPGIWEKMNASAQNALIRWAPKAPLELRAVIDDPTPTHAYRALNIPTLILRGEHAPLPCRLIAEALLRLLPDAQSMIVKGAGHMGPLTHALEVSTLIALHIVDAEVRTAPITHWRAEGPIQSTSL
jgi:pimeloyl-ACP methyl ester carboxylesterase